VKRLSADDSADSRVKVGHRQALTARTAQLISHQLGVFFLIVDACDFLYVLLVSANKKSQNSFDLT
jgi:hypothetical protein